MFTLICMLPCLGDHEAYAYIYSYIYICMGLPVKTFEIKYRDVDAYGPS